MKKPLTKFAMQMLLILSVAMVITSCKKDNQPAKKTNTPGSFTFKVDGGAAITVDSATAVLYTGTSGRQMDVYAYKGGTEVMEFHFDPKTGSKTAGTTLGTGAFLTYLASPTESYDSQTGTLNLTTCDTVGKKVEGDFNFSGKQYPYTGAGVKTITEGHMIVTKITK